MKTITIDEQLYAYIASQTKHIGEGASDILRRLLLGDENAEVPAVTETDTVSQDNSEPADAASAVDAQVNEPVTEVSAIPGGSVFANIRQSELDALSSRVEKFLALLSALHSTHPESFDKVLSVKGRNRVYFARQKDVLLEAGSSTNPKQIPHTDFWVVTNNNTAKKVAMLKQATVALGYSAEDADKLAALFN